MITVTGQDLSLCFNFDAGRQARAGCRTFGIWLGFSVQDFKGSGLGAHGSEGLNRRFQILSFNYLRMFRGQQLRARLYPYRLAFPLRLPTKLGALDSKPLKVNLQTEPKHPQS